MLDSGYIWWLELTKFAQDYEGEREIKDNFSNFMYTQLLILDSEDAKCIMMTWNIFKWLKIL